MKRKVFITLLSLLLLVICCESFDYVYDDDNTFQRKLSYLNNGYISVVLKIDPTKKEYHKKYVAPGKVIREKVFNNKSTISSELIKLVLDVVKKNSRYSGDGWQPTFSIFIKYTDRILFILPSNKYLDVIFDFTNSIIFIEGRKFVFNEMESIILKEKLDNLLNTPSP